MRFKSLSGVIRSLIRRYIVADKTANCVHALPAIKKRREAEYKTERNVKLQFRGELAKEEEYIVGSGGSVIRLKTKTHRHQFTTCLIRSLGMSLPDRGGG